MELMTVVCLYSTSRSIALRSNLMVVTVGVLYCENIQNYKPDMNYITVFEKIQYNYLKTVRRNQYAHHWDY